ncbi:MAG: NADPH-dependent oxidoreductase [Anaerolineaceae bacterium]|nr:MAG: NADPH-dependent oxidoreductase [Anaerolineaceae bacterium]
MENQNDTIKMQLSHRTIREFKEDLISEEINKQLIQVASRTASSNGMQACSIIRVTDPAIKKELADICTQEYVTRVPELWIFIVDQYRNGQIAAEKNCHEDSISDMDRFFQGFTDACLMAQNVVNAAESIGLGTVYFGSILNDPSRTIKALNLPKLTFPALGLGFGYPNQEPQLKPRMDMELRMFENSYSCFDNYSDNIKKYDEIMQTYYDLRQANQRVDSFSNQVITKLKSVNPIRQKIVTTITEQGFDLKLE